MSAAARTLASRILIIAAALCLFFAALFAAFGRSFFLPGPFADRTANCLGDPGVATFVADRITSEIVAQRPDVIGARPLILGTVSGIIGSRPFRAVARRAALRAHQAVFSESSRDVVLSIPDLDVLVRGALQHAAPDLAAKVPSGLTAKLADLGANRKLEMVIDLWHLGKKLRWTALASLIAGPLLLALALWIAPQRRRALVHCSVGVGIAGFLLLMVLPSSRIVAAVWIDDALVQNAVDGALRGYMAGLRIWGSFFVGLGVVFAAAGSALVQGLDVATVGRGIGLRVWRTPVSRGAGIAHGAAVLAAGILLLLFPHQLLTGLAMVAGTLVAMAGLRELFGLILVSKLDAATTQDRGGSRVPAWRVAAVLGLAASAAGIWLLARNPTKPEEVVAETIQACNRHPELCDRRVDEVVFAGAHNAMSNAQITDWMFPHHMKAISGQLQDGIRALLIDVHRGFPGAARIKTDIEGEKLTQERLEPALGPEGIEAAMRIRDRLVGADENRPKLYLCHGFCELGAYEVVPTFRQIRDFLVENPDEVLIIVLEDYVTIEELVRAFDESGLREFVYDGTASPWPTLRELIQSGKRAIVFIESGTPGVQWLRATIGNIQETPYFFADPSEFSCTPGRGGTEGSLFQVNHWIQTTPAPKPANATVVNAMAVLLPRVRRCATERHHLPNIIAVDFHNIGDVLAVVDTMNAISKPALP